MTLSAALSTATSSLRAIQTRISVASSNIANADDVTYTAKTASQRTVINGGVASGVSIAAIGSKVDSYLVDGIVEATSGNGAAQILYQYLQTLSNSLGTVSSDGSGDTLATQLSSLESALDELATTPESDTLKAQVVTDLEDAAASLRDTSDQVQTLRAKADNAIADAVDTVNDALHQIDSLNDAITLARASGQPTSDLEDQRNAALQVVAEQIGITSFVDSSGAMQVYAQSGQVLVGGSVHELAFTATGTVNGTSTYPGDLSGIIVDGKDITSGLSTGAIAGLVTLRDTTLTAVQDEVDALAVTLRDTVNAIANSGSAAPPPNTLTGSESVSAGDALAASGTLRVAVTDADGAVVSTADFTLSSYATVNDLLTALNTVSGLSASLDASGHLVLAADSSSNGVAVAGGSMGGENFSGYFGLNDVLVGDDAAALKVKSDLAGDSTRFPVGSMSTTGTLAAGDSAVSAGSGTLATELADALRAAGISDAAADLVSGVSTMLSSAKSRASSAETTLGTLVDTFSSQYGVNTDEETARISELQNAYAASAQVLSAVKAMFEDLLTAVR